MNQPSLRAALLVGLGAFLAGCATSGHQKDVERWAPEVDGWRHETSTDLQQFTVWANDIDTKFETLIERLCKLETDGELPAGWGTPFCDLLTGPTDPPVIDPPSCDFGTC